MEEPGLVSVAGFVVQGSGIRVQGLGLGFKDYGWGVRVKRSVLSV